MNSRIAHTPPLPDARQTKAAPKVHSGAVLLSTRHLVASPAWRDWTKLY